MKPKLYRIAQLATRPGGEPGLIPVSCATIWRWVKDGKFPAPFKIGKQTTVWSADSVNEWLAKHQPQRRAA